jgi:hypothetical protein
MKRTIGILLGLALVFGAGLAQARGGGGGHGGGGHSGGGHAGGGVGGRPGMSGGHMGGQQFTTGPMRFTTGPMHFTGVRSGVRPPVGIRPVPPIAVRPGFPHHSHRVIVGGAVFVGAPFWYPPYPYGYPYPYPYYESPGYADPAYTQQPAYIEQGDIRYYCPDSQDYYPNVPTCPSPWMQVLPGAPETTN